MTVYCTTASKTLPFEPEERGKRGGLQCSLLLPVYVGIVAVVAALCALLVLVPLLLRQMEELETTVGGDFAQIKLHSEVAWRDLLQIESEDTSVSWARIRRKTNDDFANTYDLERELAEETASGNSEAVFDGTSRASPLYPAEPIYGYKEYQCCCDLEALKSTDAIDSLPVSSSCPVGVKGPPGQRGPIGEPGEHGRPGHPGFNYPDLFGGGGGGESTAVFNAPAAYGTTGGYSLTAYAHAPAAYPVFCEPCAPGPPGPLGVKGTPGARGIKGPRGPPGRHGLPAPPGKMGPPGDLGARGRNGMSGLPGVKGLDGMRGAKGPPGVKGTQGPTGIPGTRGPQGPVGSAGATGRVGYRGPGGMKGQRGLDGIDGGQGAPGRPGGDGMYCECPKRSTQIEAYAPAPAPAPAPSPLYTKPVLIPQPTAVPRNYGRQEPSPYTRKIYVNEAVGIPVATRHDYRPSPSGTVYTTTAPPYRAASSTGYDQDEEPFLGRGVFSASTRAPLRASTWQPTREDETYGVDLEWVEEERRRHKQHRIAK